MNTNMSQRNNNVLTPKITGAYLFNNSVTALMEEGKRLEAKFRVRGLLFPENQENGVYKYRNHSHESINFKSK